MKEITKSRFYHDSDSQLKMMTSLHTKLAIIHTMACTYIAGELNAHALTVFLYH